MKEMENTLYQKIFLNIGSKILPLPDAHMSVYLGYIEPKQEKALVK